MYGVCAVFSSVVCPSVLYFSTLPHKRFRGEGIIEHEMCVLIYFTIFVRKFFYSKKNTSIYYNIYFNFLLLYSSLHISTGLHVFLSDFNGYLIFFFATDFSENSQIYNSVKISPVGAELFRADRETWGWWHFILRRIPLHILIYFSNFYYFICHIYPQVFTYSCQILMEIKCNFSRQIFPKIRTIPWKSIQWEQSCSVRKLTVTIHNFANAYKRIS